MTDRFRAHVAYDPIRNTMKLDLIEDAGQGRVKVLMTDYWLTLTEGERLPDGTGIELPPQSLPAIAEAIAKATGEVLPSKAEVRVLREWLAHERGRVDLFFPKEDVE